MTTYTDAQRIAALAALEANGGNVKRTARETGVPEATVRLWRLNAEAGGAVAMLRPAAPVKTDWEHIWGASSLLGAEIIHENLTRYRGQKLAPGDLKNVAVVAGISRDAHLDYRDGRKSASVTVDARSVNLTQLTDEQLARLKEAT